MADSRSGLKIDNRTAGGMLVVAVAGEVDLHTSPRLRGVLTDMVESASGTLCIDLSEVSYMDSSGVGTLVYIKREVERRNVRLVLAGLQPRVRSVFEITHLTKFFEIVDSVEEAKRE